MLVVQRFIPAYAGNTILACRWSGTSTVHPRLRGEHGIMLEISDYFSGSSPPTRGTPAPWRLLPGIGRFIPAYAGNTPLPGERPALPPVHPRLRGEHYIRRNEIRNSSGSSPPTRGTLHHPEHRLGRDRFIPAYAGNTRQDCLRLSPITVHPRLRGEHAAPCITS